MINASPQNMSCEGMAARCEGWGATILLSSRYVGCVESLKDPGVPSWVDRVASSFVLLLRSNDSLQQASICALNRLLPTREH